ncbi:MAG TPA: immune inhibitor A [Anaerolineae bacterium]|nr:immune inhibitor A [Anaerolineae bacterium]
MRRTQWLPLLIAGLALVAGCCLVAAGACAFLVARSVGHDADWSWTWSTSGSEPQPTPDPTLFGRTPTEAERATAERVSQTRLPPRDLLELAQRLGRKTPPPIAQPRAPEYAVGDRQAFWVHDQETSTYYSATATLQFATPHAYWWVEEGYEIPVDDLEFSAQEFEGRTYPTNLRLFGSEPNPGVDGDPHVYIFLGNVPGVGGYFSSSDAFPPLISEHSNGHEMFYINLENASPGSSYFDGILAHELQHMSQWAQDRNEDTWLNEGFSEVTVQVNGYETGSPDRAYALQPDTQLTSWPEREDSAAHYGASFLFVSYFLDRFGEESLHRLAVDKENGLASVDAVIGQRGDLSRPSLSLFADWAVANYLDDPYVDEGRYEYRQIDLERPEAAARHTTYPVHQSASVRQFGVDYVELGGRGDVTMTFAGSLVVPLVGCQPHSGERFWWSNRGDDSDVTLTRAFDLTGLDEATLTAWTWYHLETDYDYAYVQASPDGGKSWDLLPGTHTTTLNRVGSSYGQALNGISGGGDEPRWVEQTFDLSRYAGGLVLIRFEVIYDDSVNYPGLCLDDLSIPEISFSDGAETIDDSWESQGWIRATGYVPQEFLVQVITLGRETRVARMDLDAGMRGTLEVDGLGDEVERAVLVISGIAPATTDWAGYEYRVTEK